MSTTPGAPAPTAVQIQAARLEVRLRESLGEPVDVRLRDLAALHPPAGAQPDGASAPRPGVEGGPSVRRRAEDVSSWLLDTFIASGHPGQYWVVRDVDVQQDPLPGMPHDGQVVPALHSIVAPHFYPHGSVVWQEGLSLALRGLAVDHSGSHPDGGIIFIGRDEWQSVSPGDTAGLDDLSPGR